MRRKIGVGAVKDRLNEQEKYSKMGKSMEETKISFVKDLMGKFQSSLTEFAIKHRDRINSDPEFRQQFHKMCVSVGVDPLASNKGFWSDILGVGDFYFDLGVKIIEITVQARSLNGGIMSVEEVLDKLQQSNPQLRGHIVRDDVMRAVDKIKVLGSGFRIVRIGRRHMIVSVPMEINQDHEIIMDLAQTSEGMFTKDMLVHGLSWPEERFNRVINALLQDGIVWIDHFEGMRLRRCCLCFGSFLSALMSLMLSQGWTTSISIRCGSHTKPNSTGIDVPRDCHHQHVQSVATPAKHTQSTRRSTPSRSTPVGLETIITTVNIKLNKRRCIACERNRRSLAVFVVLQCAAPLRIDPSRRDEAPSSPQTARTAN